MKFKSVWSTPLVSRCAARIVQRKIPRERSFAANARRRWWQNVLAAAAVAPHDVAGERRHLTVLFCDLVGSTEIASHLDPEQWREIVGEYHRAAAQAIERFGGHVAQFLVDGVMAYFGWPEAHDNDAERAG